MRIRKFDQALIHWIEKHLRTLAFLFFLILSVWIRFSLRDGISGDANGFLLLWYDEIKTNGGLKALESQVGDYNMLYQFILALMTYLPLKPLYAIKLASVIFDYVLAFGVGLLVKDLTGKQDYAGFAFLATVLSPLVWLNSSYWAQCDAMYVSFCVLSLVYFLREKYHVAFLLYGISFAFKLQAIFLLPLYLFLYLYQKRYSILSYLWIPIMMMLSSIPCVLAGRGKKSVFRVLTFYFQQTETWKKMYLNYPSFWAIVGENEEAFYDVMHVAAILLTVALLAALMIFWKRHSIVLTKENILFMGFLLAYTCVYFLPAMHDRYNFLAEILAIAIAFVLPKTIWLLIPLNLVSLATYGSYLSAGVSSEHLALLAIVNGAVLAGYLFVLNRQMISAKDA